MYCKICKHNFNSGDSYVQIGNVTICAECSFKTTVRDLAVRGVFPVLTLDENAIDADFVVVDGPSLETRPEKPAAVDVVYDELHDEENATPEQVEKFFTSPDSVFVPEKENT